MDEEFCGWSMELIYDLLSIQGIDIFEEIRTNENLTEEEKRGFWKAYQHYIAIEYWRSKQ